MSTSTRNLSEQDLNWITKRLPLSVKEMLKTRKDVFLAGGFIRSCITREEVQDIDLFVSSKDVANLVALKLCPAGHTVFETDNAFTVKVNGIAVQVIHRWVFNTPLECIASFDFTIASAAVWYDNGWQSACDKSYYEDLAARRLVYRSPKRNEDAGGSILRVLKFYQRGYRIPLSSLGAVVSRLMSGVDQSKLAKDGGGEERLAEILTGLLHEVDPNTPFHRIEF